MAEQEPTVPFNIRLDARSEQYGTSVCVGLDSDLSKIPQSLKDRVPQMTIRRGFMEDISVEEVMYEFNRQIIDATHDLVCAYKPNAAFYEAQGEQGSRALRRTIEYLRDNYDVPAILDAKRGDIDNTNLGYITSAFDDFKADAITVHPYLGQDALQPFLDRADKGIFVLARTSNKGAGEFQDIHIGLTGPQFWALMRGPSSPYKDDATREMIDQKVAGLVHLYDYVTFRVANFWNKNGNLGVVAGATSPKELENIRLLVGDMPILIPGIGAQGGEVESTVKAGKNSNNRGMIINSSRGIIFKSKGDDFASAARAATLELRDQINSFLT